VDLDTEIAYGALDFRAAAQELDGPKISSAPTRRTYWRVVIQLSVRRRLAGRSGSPSSFSTNASRTASDRARCLRGSCGGHRQKTGTDSKATSAGRFFCDAQQPSPAKMWLCLFAASPWRAQRKSLR